VKEAYETFKKMALDTFEPGLEILYKPSAEDEQKCYDFGVAFAKQVKEYHKKFE
jgi:flavorubredoxin